jgi:hypothetical protein
VGKTTVEEVISSITTGLYNSGCIFYDSNTVLSLEPNVKNEFPLANFLSYSRPVNGQCTVRDKQFAFQVLHGMSA